MEEDVRDKLRDIFDVCDEDKEGFITIDHFKNLAKEHFGTESDGQEIIGIIQLLDPNGKGKISFDEFCSGVQQITDIRSPTSTPIQKKDPFSTLNFDLLGDVSPTECQETSEASAYTFNEYDTNTDEDNGVLIDLSTPDPIRRNNNVNRSFNGIHDYTDYGEEDIESDTSDPSHNKSCVTCDKIRSKRGVHYREKRRTSGARKLTSTAYAAQLHSKSRSPAPDEVFDDIDGNFQHLNDRVQFLEKQLTNLSEEKSNTDGAHYKLKDENSVLMESIVDRIHMLEEQVKDVEVKSDERVSDEQKKYKEILSRQEREKSEQMEYFTQRLQNLEKENELLKMENPRLRSEIDRLKIEKLELEDKITELQVEYSSVMNENSDLKLKFDRERETTGQLLDELGKELGELRQYKIEAEVRPRRDSQIQVQGRYQTLQTEIHRLKEALTVEWNSLSQENRGLLELNEDLNAQLLSRCISEGRNLTEGSQEQSLASELEHLTKTELMGKVQEQERELLRLKQYIDKILLAILEKNPSILEIVR
ncbi:rab11 family-interacting protein 4A-like isoform X3 [Mytilus californianus]|uniref:rab11 family-interacting protein 4A-like isoform X3 n=1 Tax=Mytilus californianus TaxID=6549 RepID=UPI002245C145|nr:rab11 family-interacting protein 4A-like isoform X3 [Mytilus californianus]